MPRLLQRHAGPLAIALCVGLLATLAASPGGAQGKTRVKKAEGRFVAFDPEASTVTVRVKGKETVYDVKADGSVMTRTTVSMNATPARVPDIPPGVPVIVYYVPPDADGKKAGQRSFARKIDAPKIPKEFLDDWE